MASPAANKVVTARAAAILTTGAVDASIFTLPKAWAERLAVDMRFTLGSLTNCTFAFYVADKDQTAWIPIESAGGNVSWVPTASGNRSVVIEAPGWSFFKVTCQGSGTVTSSSATVYYRWITRAV